MTRSHLLAAALLLLLSSASVQAWPQITEVITLGDRGRVDGLWIGFDEPVDASGVDVTDFSFRGCVCAGLRFQANVSSTDHLFLQFEPEGDSALQPYLAYRPIAGARIQSDDGGLNDTVIGSVDRAPPTPLEAVTEDRDGDGRPDGVRIRFSERVYGTSFDAAYWRVGDGEVRRGDFDYGDRNVVRLVVDFPPGTQGDARPEVTTVADGGLADASSVLLRRIAPGTVAVADGVAPRILSAHVDRPGSPMVLLRFSEPVRWAGDAGSPLVLGDVGYEGEGGPMAIQELAHDAGSALAWATLDAPFNATHGGRMTVPAGRIADMAGNVAPAHDVPVLVDSAAPRRIEDLRATARGADVLLQWTAPDDGDLAAYEIRVLDEALGQDPFVAGVEVEGPAPRPGSAQQTLIQELVPGRHYLFAVRSVDAAGNVAEASASVGATPFRDRAPPAAVTDLGADLAGTEAVLRWTAPADDVAVVGYDLRWTKGALDRDRLDAAERLGAPTPAAAGTPQESRLAGLEQGTSYEFALRSVDAAGNMGPLSNIAILKVPAPGPTPTSTPVSARVLETASVVRTEGGNLVGWTAFPGELRSAGVQIWSWGEGAASPAFVATVRSTDPGFAAREHLHAGGGASDGYLVTVFDDESPEAGFFAPGDAPQDISMGTFQAARAPQGGDTSPLWIGALAIVLLLAGGVGTVAVLRHRRRLAELVQAGRPERTGQDGEDGPALGEGMEASDGTSPEPGGEDGPQDTDWAEAARAPPEAEEVHEVECPSCLALFTAQGELPLEIHCPECGASGMLE